MNSEVKEFQDRLIQHPLYGELNSVQNLKVFMAHHVFAVWDFMSLLKSLQRSITCVEVPWRPSVYPASLVRFINEIVISEESDLDQNGAPTSHFELYLNAMTELGADTAPIRSYLRTLDPNLMPVGVRDFVQRNLALAQSGNVTRIAAAFLYGREKLIPEMFEQMVQVLERENINAPSLLYYLKRHIQIDGEEHGPMAERCLNVLCFNEEQTAIANSEGIQSLQARWDLWDQTLTAIKLLSLTPQTEGHVSSNSSTVMNGEMATSFQSERNLCVDNTQ